MKILAFFVFWEKEINEAESKRESHTYIDGLKTDKMTWRPRKISQTRVLNETRSCFHTYNSTVEVNEAALWLMADKTPEKGKCEKILYEKEEKEKIEIAERIERELHGPSNEEKAKCI